MFDLIPEDQLDDNTVVLCPSLRLANALQASHARRHASAGPNAPPRLVASTPAQWLASILEGAHACGDPALAGETPKVLSPMQSRILWERALQGLAKEEDGILFDQEGLASTAAEAHKLMLTWEIDLHGQAYSEETQRFREWQSGFLEGCASLKARDDASFRVWSVDRIVAGAGVLPVRVAFAGQDHMNPQDSRLAEALVARGVDVYRYDFGLPTPGPAVSTRFPDREAECRAAAAWAAEYIARHPEGKIGIMVPDLGPMRETLSSVLDDAFHPESARASMAQMPRMHNFSLGLPLSRQPLIGTALQLLYLAANPRRVEQADFGGLLLSPYWSADVSEADGRAQLDVLIRRHLPHTTSLHRLNQFAFRYSGNGLHVSRLVSDLRRFLDAQSSCGGRHLPSQWTLHIGTLLDAARWPGQRPLSPHEHQARHAFTEVLNALPDLDAVLAKVTLSDVLRRVTQLCNDTIHQPSSPGTPRVEVMGMLESAGEPLEALWVMGMNDQLWPPQARPNPLLPADLQRKVKSPNSCSEVQTEFAQAIHDRLLHTAYALVFSWAQAEGGRELRPSPMIAGIPEEAMARAPAFPDVAVASATIEEIDDTQAPPVADGEKVTGGVSLLQAQAICPAWAFYRFRLGAIALPTPAEGIDSLLRGTLLHLAMQTFWQGRGQAELLAMSPIECQAAIQSAVDLAIVAASKDAAESLPKQLLVLERDRLLLLLADWMHLEAQRRVPFRVVECEKELILDIEGIVIRLQVDRIDELDSGQHIVLDYKTGSRVSKASWSEERIRDPQLPMYAAVLPGVPAAGIAYARVRPGEPEFSGVTSDAGMLPGVSSLEDSRRQFDEATFPTWASLTNYWRDQITLVAREIKDGHAAVTFGAEGDLDAYYCEVRPLLRLPEYRAQRARVAAEDTS